MDLNQEQRDAEQCSGDVVVTACPGSGKTRVLTARVIRGIEGLKTVRQRIAALTFTNRSANEIRTRLDSEGVPTKLLWAGTIHAFSLEWILRPYAPYSEIVRYGFSVADEYFSERSLREIRKKLGLNQFTEINTTYNRDGNIENASEKEIEQALVLYKEDLRNAKVIDYDEVLYLAYRLVADNPEIAANLNSIFQLFCVDEVQDIQDLQYGILSEIYRASEVTPEMFFVGDADQSIYESLGALAKSPSEISHEFGMENLQHFELIGNYRSTQRIINFCKLLRPNVKQSESRIDQPHEHGHITFENQTIHKDDLSKYIANIVQLRIDSGVPAEEICIIAPQWRHVRLLAHQLLEGLPNVSFDAPGLSPLYGVRDTLWYKLARLFLTEPVPARIGSRIRCANEVIRDLEFLMQSELPEVVCTARRILRTVNQLQSTETEGIPYLRDLYSQFLVKSEISLDAFEALNESFELFFEKASARLRIAGGSILANVSSFKKIFNYPSGVVVNTCHGVKGEEFDTVIAFGLLKGYVPHWSVIINGTQNQANEQESKLLYVVASRAKRQLHLIAEDDRQTQNGNIYETSRLLGLIDFNFDKQEISVPKSDQSSYLKI